MGPTGSTAEFGHDCYRAATALTEAEEAGYRKLAPEDHLCGLGQEDFVQELAGSWGELNVVHSFREGSTRTQVAFSRRLAEQAGYRIDTRRFAPGAPLRGDFVAARFHSQDTGSNDRLAAVLGQAIAPAPQPEPDLET